MKEEEETTAQWPHPLMQFLWDLLPAKSKWVPSDSGLKPPTFNEPKYQAAMPRGEKARDVLLSVALEACEAANQRVTRAEERASRMVNLVLTLFGVSSALLAYQFGRLPSAPLWVARGATFIALGTLAQAGIEALEIDRVGLSHPASVEELIGQREWFVMRLRALERERQVVTWVARNKLSRLLQARAWFSRGIVALVLAGTLTAIVSPPRGEAKSIHHRTPHRSGVCERRLSHRGCS